MYAGRPTEYMNMSAKMQALSTVGLKGLFRNFSPVAVHKSFYTSIAYLVYILPRSPSKV
jgi:hypothetical protein